MDPETASSVWVFFYGGLMNPKVMDRVGLKPRRQEPATLSGFDLRIEPYVNLVPCPGHAVFGVLMEVTHAELQRTYAQLKVVYSPEAVVAQTMDGRLRPALCYLCAAMPAGQADAAHVEDLAGPAEQLGFPSWYVAKIRSFLPR
jgi:hypothetical protein